MKLELDTMWKDDLDHVRNAIYYFKIGALPVGWFEFTLIRFIQTISPCYVHLGVFMLDPCYEDIRIMLTPHMKDLINKIYCP